MPSARDVTSSGRPRQQRLELLADFDLLYLVEDSTIFNQPISMEAEAQELIEQWLAKVPEGPPSQPNCGTFLDWRRVARVARVLTKSETQREQNSGTMEGPPLSWSQLTMARSFVCQRSTNDLEMRVQTLDNECSSRLQAISMSENHGARLEMTSMSTSDRARRGIGSLEHTRTKGKGHGQAGRIR